MPKVMFVCTANLCRSPIAAFLFAQWLQQHSISGTWMIESCGTWAHDGEPVPAIVLPHLLAAGIDLSQHRSRSVTEELVAGSGLVLCMTGFHKEALQAEFPLYAQHIYMLSEMIHQHFDIQDVSRVTPEEYLAVAKGLKQIIERTAPLIVEFLQPARSSV